MDNPGTTDETTAKLESFNAYVTFVEKAKEELYIALQALEDENLPWARSSAARAQGLINEAHRARSKANDSKKVDKKK